MPGPTIIPSGLIIGTTGGQFTPTPGDVQAAQHRLSRSTSKPNSRDEIVKAVRENLLFGAKAIKICLDCKPWGYSVDDIKLFIAEAAKGGAKVDGARPDARRRAARDRRRHPRHLARAADHARAARADGAEDASTSPARTRRSRRITDRRKAQKRAADQLKRAWEKGVPITFSTDMDYWSERIKNANGEWMNRGDLTINFLLTWKAAGIPAKDTLKAMTINGYKAADVYKDERGPIKVGLLRRHHRRRRAIR